MHVRHGNLDSAIEILKFACFNHKSQLNLNIRCRQMLVDLHQAKHRANKAEDEKVVRALEKQVRDTYAATLELKIITPVMGLNFVDFLERECSMFEESFRVCERLVEAFEWPHKFEIWVFYLRAATERFKMSKVERVRELYSKCIESLPCKTRRQDPSGSQPTKGSIPEDGKVFFLMLS